MKGAQNGALNFTTKEALVADMKTTDAYTELKKWLSQEFERTAPGITSDQKAGKYQSDTGGSSNPALGYTGSGPSSTPKGLDESILNAVSKGMDSNNIIGSSINSSGSGPGSFTPGLGIKSLDGNYIRDRSLNAAGGRLDTIVSSDPVSGDNIVQGPRTVLTATQTLRPKMPIAGGDDVREDPGKAVVSNVVFETFSHVPEQQTDHLQAPNSRINMLNRQNETIRYMETMSQPRAYDPANDPHSRPWQWENEFNNPMFQAAFSMEVKRHLDEQSANKRYRQNEDMDGRLEEDYTEYPSSKRLHRPTPSLYNTVANNIESMLPSRQDTGFLMNRRRFRDQDRSTWRSIL